MLRDELLSALAPREEKVVLAGQTLTVRELETAADVTAFQDQSDTLYKLLVRSTFDADGNAVFTDADIPALKKSGSRKILPLMEAVARVNGMNTADNEKKSDPQSPA